MKQFLKFLYKYRFWIVLILALLSRFIFLSAYKDFFDSMQYVWRTDSGSLFDALSTGHAPYHPGFIFFTYYFNQLLHLFGLYKTELAATLPALTFGSLSILVFYAFTEKMFDTKTSILATILVAFVPYFWISNMAIIVDPTMIFFYLLSMYLYYIWLTDKNHSWYYLLLSGFSFGWAMWAHTQIAFWVLGFVGLLFYTIEPKKWISYILKSIPWAIGPVFFIYIYLFLLVSSGHSVNYSEALFYLFLGNAGDRMNLNPLPGIRNYLILVSTFLAGLSLIGFIKLLFKKTKLATFLLIWMLPGLFVSALYLYANLYGRSSMIAIFPAMMAVAYLLTSWQPKNVIIITLKYIVIVLAIAQLLHMSYPIVKLYAQEFSPYEEMDVMRKTLKPDGGVIVLSNLEKTLVGYEGDSVVVWEMPKDTIKKAIKKAEDSDKPIFVDIDAIRFPYYQYDGHNWEIKSTITKAPGEHKSFLDYLFTDYNFTLALTSNLGNKVGTYELTKNNLSDIYRLEKNINVLDNGQTLIFGNIFDENIGSSTSRILIDAYSQSVPISKQKINYNDWLFYLYNIYQKKYAQEYLDPLNWMYTDKDGYFTFTIPKDETKSELDLVATSYNLPLKDVANLENNTFNDFKFVESKSQELNAELVNKETIDINELNIIIDKINQLSSYYLIINKDNNKISYQLYKTKYTLPIGETIKAEFLPHEIGEVKQGEIDAQKGSVGFLTFGPWISLPTGSYEIIYTLKTSKNTDDEIIGSIEVTSNYQAEPLAKKDLIISEFTEPNIYYEIKLDLKTDDVEDVEFKTILNGVVDLAIKNIKINKK